MLVMDSDTSYLLPEFSVRMWQLTGVTANMQPVEHYARTGKKDKFLSIFRLSIELGLFGFHIQMPTSLE